MALIPYWKWRYGWDYAVPEEGQQGASSSGQGKCRQVDYLLENETHYILVIHGTFDAPNPDNTPPKWYQLDPQNPQNFTTILQSSINFLREEMAPDSKDPDSEDFRQQYRVWKPLPGQIPEGLKNLDPKHGLWNPFSWDGENSDDSRVKAAKRLGKLMHFIATEDPSARIHVVAHSHGGNVLLKAVEGYMGELAVQRQADWSCQIRQSFWNAYKSPWLMARKWHTVPHVSFYRRLYPFLILSRTLTGDVTRGLERYPFAYYKWMDDLLGLGDIRQQIYLRHRKASSPVTNALGNLVFLGTPFLVRRFSRSGICFLGVTIVVKAAAASALLWGYTAIIIRLATQGEHSYQELGAFAFLFVVIFVVALGAMSWTSVGRVAMEHGNMYHRIKFNWSSAMLCLVAHAGLLDEAAMGLSAEPVVEGLLEPKITRLMLASRFQSWPALPGNKYNVLSWLGYVGKALFSLWINGLGLIPLIQTIIGNVLGPVFGGALKNMLMQMTLGLSDKDYSYGRIDVEHVLRLPVADVQHWNVQRLIAAHQQKDSKFTLKLKDGQLLRASEIVERQMKDNWQAAAPLPRSSRLPGAKDPRNGRWGNSDACAYAEADLESPDSAQLLLQHSMDSAHNPPGVPELPANGVAPPTQELAKSTNQGSSQLIGEYSFLWNKEELDKEAEESHLYKALENRLDKLRRNPDLTETQFQDEVKGICIMFEKRIEDIAGGVEFSHSIYFKNTTIIYAFAHFMVHRELPQWANEELGVAKDVTIKVADD